MLISDLCSICYFCCGVGEERLCVVLQGALASEVVEGTLWYPLSSALQPGPSHAPVPEIGDSFAISLPSCTVCSQLTKARSQRGIRVVSGATVGGGGVSMTWAEEVVNGAFE